MGRPQQPELARSGNTELVPEHTETVLEGRRHPGRTGSGNTGPVPEGNRSGPRPGHGQDKEQDKPDPYAFAARLGVPPANRTERLFVAAVTAPLRLTNRMLAAALRRLERSENAKRHKGKRQ